MRPLYRRSGRTAYSQSNLSKLPSLLSRWSWMRLDRTLLLGLALSLAPLIADPSSALLRSFCAGKWRGSHAAAGVHHCPRPQVELECHWLALAEEQDWLDGERSLIGRRRRENDWDATTALDARTG